MLLNKSRSKPKPKRRVSFAPKCELAIYQPDATDADTAETCDDTTLSSNDSLDEGSYYSSSSMHGQQSSSLVVQVQVQHYRLGDCIRSQHHMVQHQHPLLEEAIQSVYALQLSEFAWIKRKNGDQILLEILTEILSQLWHTNEYTSGICCWLCLCEVISMQIGG